MSKVYLPKRQIKFHNKGKNNAEFYAEVDRLGNVNFHLWIPGNPRQEQIDISHFEVNRLKQWLEKIEAFVSR